LVQNSVCLESHNRPNSFMPKKTSKPARFLCTACGESLDEFCFSEGADDVKAIIQRMATCKKEGKFEGHFCARLFIASSNGTARSLTSRKVPTRKIASLRASIVRRIGSEVAGPPATKRKSRKLKR
jgi:hypothetical protein